jgi:hypothetical protein
VTDDDTIRAASDAIDGYCAANPAPVWQFSMPADVPFTPRTEPVEVTYVSTAEASAALRRLMLAAELLANDWPKPGTPEHRQAVRAAINDVERFFTDLTTPAPVAVRPDES